MRATHVFGSDTRAFCGSCHVGGDAIDRAVMDASCLKIQSDVGLAVARPLSSGRIEEP